MFSFQVERREEVEGRGPVKYASRFTGRGTRDSLQSSVGSRQLAVFRKKSRGERREASVERRGARDCGRSEALLFRASNFQKSIRRAADACLGDFGCLVLLGGGRTKAQNAKSRIKLRLRRKRPPEQGNGNHARLASLFCRNAGSVHGFPKCRSMPPQKQGRSPVPA